MIEHGLTREVHVREEDLPHLSRCSPPHRSPLPDRQRRCELHYFVHRRPQPSITQKRRETSNEVDTYNVALDSLPCRRYHSGWCTVAYVHLLDGEIVSKSDLELLALFTKKTAQVVVLEHCKVSRSLKDQICTRTVMRQ